MLKKKQASRHTLKMAGSQAPARYVEAYKSLRTNLAFMPAAEKVKVIAVTSSVPGEGKSSVAYNLAQTLACTGKRVVLVDGDLRTGGLTQYLQINKEHSGISDVLAGTGDLDKIRIPLEDKNLALVPAGPLPPNPTELLSAPRMEELIRELRGSADSVIIDTPPAAALADAVLWGHAADGVLLVVRPGKVKNREAQLAKKNLEAAGARILGAVVNG